MDLIKNILAEKKFDEPSSVEAVKKYIRDNLNTDVSVSISKNSLMVIVKSSALASQIRLRQFDISQKCDLSGLKLVIRTV